MNLTDRTNRGKGDYGGFVVLPEEIPDAEIIASLADAGIEAKGESSETVFLNDFSEVMEIPLGEYFGRIETFDPRNDGYAQRLRACYVSDGKRRIFIEGGDAKKIAAVLAAYPDAAFVAPKRFNFFPFAVFLFAAALLTVIFSALKPLAREYFHAWLRRQALAKPFHKANLAALAEIYPRNAAAACAAAIVYLLLCIAVFVFSGLLVLPVFLALALFFPAAYLFFKADAASSSDKFLPLPIIAKPRFRSIIPPAALVFLATALILSVVHLTTNLTNGTNLTNSNTIFNGVVFGQHPTEEEFAAHKNFQEAFSRRRLSGGDGAYGDYTAGSDGLIEGFSN